MAEYKLTTVATFSDNTECEEYGDLQDYVEKVAKDILSNWDTASVLLEVDGLFTPIVDMLPEDREYASVKLLDKEL